MLATVVVFLKPQKCSAEEYNSPTSGVCNSYSDLYDTFNKCTDYQGKLSLLDSSNTEEWFKQYKELQIEYADYIDPDETIYDYYTEDELSLLFAIVEAEVTGEGWFDEKCNVASVIFERVEHEDFDDTIVGILTSKSQFSSYWDGRYLRVYVTDETKLACEYAFQFGGTADEALFFDNVKGKSWASTHKSYLFTDDAHHSFYK